MPESTRHCISGAHVRPSDNEPEQRGGRTWGSRAVACDQVGQELKAADTGDLFDSITQKLLTNRHRKRAHKFP